MKLLLISIGTRGDMEPFLAIGELLREKGHRVICAFPEQFKDLVRDTNLEFASLGSKYVDVLDSEDGRAAMGGGGSGLGKWLANIRLAGRQTEANQELVHRQYEIVTRENPDRILYNSQATYPVIWGLDHPDQVILLSSVPYLHYVRGHSHLAFHSNLGPVLNKLTYSLANFGMMVTTLISARWLDLERKITLRQVKKGLASTKAIYMISPSLFPRPDYWDERLQVLGYHERSKTVQWQPEDGLLQFLGKHDRILFITFGSMLNPSPGEVTSLILDILDRNKIPAIINTASGGLIEPEVYDPELFHFVTRIPYDWIFPKIYAVIHHGGSGTTHLALKYGRATMIVPHIIDQFVWNEMVSHLGAGPKGTKVESLTTKDLEPKILELMEHGAYKKNAERIAAQMTKEDFREELYQAIVGG